jgi:hypothetical protein
MKNGDPVQLARITPADLHRSFRSIRERTIAPERSSVLGRAAAVPVRLARRAARLLDFGLETALRALLRSPTAVVRTTQSPVGDDSASVIRLHPELFASLGLRPGMQVTVTWCGLQVAALALNDYEAYDQETSSFLKERQAVERTASPDSSPLPAHLVARLSLSTRHQLGIPAQTVVEIRRRLRPMVLSQLNQLTIPVTGIFLAGAAIPSLRGWPLVGGLAIVILFGLAPLRRASPPKGLLP